MKMTDPIAAALGMRPMNEQELASVAEGVLWHLKNNLGCVDGVDITNSFYGKTHTAETRVLLSESAKTRTGARNPMFGRTHSESTRAKISAKAMGQKRRLGAVLSEESRRKISESKKGKRAWFNDGSQSVLAAACPDGFVPGRLAWRKS